jgi:hypothetical protein
LSVGNHVEIDMSNIKVRTAAKLGHAPVAIAKDATWAALRTGFSSPIYAEATEADAKAEYIEGFVSMGFSVEQAEAMHAGG